VWARRSSFQFWLAFGLLIAASSVPRAHAHDIPNQRVDRSIQVTVKPGRLEIDYEVSLTELTLTQDLRALVGVQPGTDREEWLALYGRVTGPMNAKGFLVSVDGAPRTLSAEGYRLAVEGHPRYTFRLQTEIAATGRLVIRDTNFISSQGTSRLAIRGADGVALEGSEWPTDVERVPIRPVWDLSDEEERRTKEAQVGYHTSSNADNRPGPESLPGAGGPDSPRVRDGLESAARSTRTERWRWASVADLLDRSATLSWATLIMIALGLGAAHAVQPGHGKTMVTAVALGPETKFYQPLLLGLVTSLAHTGSVLLIALALWYTGTSQVESIHQGLAHVAGFVIAGAGLWRVGRHLGGYSEHGLESMDPRSVGDAGLISLGVAGGAIPCWEAVGLLVLSAALGRLTAGLVLVLAFSAGMATVLITVGCLAWKVRSATVGFERASIWHHRLGILCGLLLAAVGVWLLIQ
jgi:ABC-type nickel/cobalt efflux system permease component RcnA